MDTLEHESILCFDLLIIDIQTLYGRRQDTSFSGEIIYPSSLPPWGQEREREREREREDNKDVTIHLIPSCHLRIIINEKATGLRRPTTECLKAAGVWV